MEIKKRRIAVFHNLPGGGGIRMLKNIVNRYKNKYKIDIFSIGEIKQKRFKGVKTMNFLVKPWSGFLLRNIWIITVLPYIHKKLSKTINENYDFAIVTHDYFTKSPYLLRYLRVKNIYLCQEPQREFYEPQSIHTTSLKEKVAYYFRLPIKFIDETNVEFADVIICNSRYSLGVIKKVYGRAGHIVYPGVNDRYFYPSKSKKENVILCIGGINSVKDQLFLVSSLKPILDKYKLILVGQGRESYIKKVLDVGGGNSNIKILNKVTDGELRSLYRKAMVTCMTAFREPFGLSSIESQSCGTPVVSVDDGGTKETIVNGKTGYVVKKNADTFLNKVLLAIKNNRRMGKNARKNIINTWSWSKTLKNFDFYLR